MPFDSVLIIGGTTAPSALPEKGKKRANLPAVKMPQSQPLQAMDSTICDLLVSDQEIQIGKRCEQIKKRRLTLCKMWILLAI